MKSDCIKATTPISKETHLNAHEIPAFPTSRISFSSCARYKASLYNPNIWKHVRNIWLGDNIYADGVDMNYKRKKYNSVRNDVFYNTYGLIGEPKIPVTAVWGKFLRKKYSCLIFITKNFVFKMIMILEVTIKAKNMNVKNYHNVSSAFTSISPKQMFAIQITIQPKKDNLVYIPHYSSLHRHNINLILEVCMSSI